MRVPVQGKTTEGRFGGDARYLRSAVGPLVLTLWHGPGQSMELWKKGLPPRSRLGEEVQVAACGRPARRIEAQLASRRIRRGRPAAIKLDEPKPSQATSATDVVELPPRTVVAVAFEQNGRPVMLTWDIEAARREHLETQEKQFFAGLHCE